MARPITREVRLKTGFYMEVRNKGAQKGIKIWRATYKELQDAMKRYEANYVVKYLGEAKNGKIQS